VRARPQLPAAEIVHHPDHDLGATTSQVLTLRDHLLAADVTLVVMEATSDYWKPFVRHEAPGIERG
jgi:hypothetical protein